VALHRGGGEEGSDRAHGRAVQVDPIKPMLKPPGTKRLKLECAELGSNFAFNFNLRRYTTGEDGEDIWLGKATVEAGPTKVGRCRFTV